MPDGPPAGTRDLVSIEPEPVNLLDHRAICALLACGFMTINMGISWPDTTPQSRDGSYGRGSAC